MITPLLCGQRSLCAWRTNNKNYWNSQIPLESYSTVLFEALYAFVGVPQSPCAAAAPTTCAIGNGSSHRNFYADEPLETITIFNKLESVGNYSRFTIDD